MDKENLGVYLDAAQPKENSMYLVLNVVLICFLLAVIVGLLFMMPLKNKERKEQMN